MTSQHLGPSIQVYPTPWPIVRAVEGDCFGGEPFALDAAADASNTKAARFYDIAANGLVSPWCDRTWINPPYFEQERWLARGVHFAERGMRSAHLVLASTSSLYWHDLVHSRARVDFYRGRIAFIDPATGLPKPGTSFASALVLMGPGFTPGAVRYRDAATGELIANADTRADLFTQERAA